MCMYRQETFSIHRHRNSENWKITTVQDNHSQYSLVKVSGLLFFCRRLQGC